MAKRIDVRETNNSKYPLEVTYGSDGDHVKVFGPDDEIALIFDDVKETVSSSVVVRIDEIDSLIKALETLKDELGVPREYKEPYCWNIMKYDKRIYE